MMTSTSRWCARALLALLYCAALPSSVFSQEKAGPAPGQAPVATAQPKTPKEFITRATQYFSAGEYEKAIEDYRAAYQMKQLPTLLFNIAQAQRKANHYEEALTSYERFLKEDPKSPLAPEAEAQATAMRARIEAEKATAEREAAQKLAQQRVDEAEALAKAREEERRKAEAALLLATTQKKPIYKKAWFWVVIGGVVVAGAVGIGLAVALQPKDPTSDLGVRVVQF